MIKNQSENINRILTSMEKLLVKKIMPHFENLNQKNKKLKSNLNSKESLLQEKDNKINML
jgi:hypothetical protein